MPGILVTSGRRKVAGILENAELNRASGMLPSKSFEVKQLRLSRVRN